LLSATAASAAWGQLPIRGTVVAEIGRTPIPNAVVIGRAGRAASTTDRLGRFALVLPGPDSLVVAAIGWRPDTVLVTTASDSLVIELARAPAVLSELIATASAAPLLELGAQGRWEMPIAVARTVPPAVETDVYRALAMVPGVSFTSPLSARPMIRGYDAQEVTTRIDGFEVLNLFHVGRVFSSFPADAAEEIAVSAPPYGGGTGGSVAGVIDLTGRTGSADGVHGSAGTSFGSVAASAGGGNDRIRAFGTARLFHLKLLELAPGIDVPYHFEDFYGSVVLGAARRPRGRLTMFATQDRAGRSVDNRLEWSNALVGGRWRLVERGPAALDVAASGAWFSETGANVPSAHAEAADFKNRFFRAAARADLEVRGSRGRLDVGAEAGLRRVENRIRPTRGQAAALFPTTATMLDHPELTGHVSLARRFGAVAVEGTVRLDAARAVRVSPRFHARWLATPGVSIGAGVGRTVRLYQLLSDARSEPDLDFLDFWLASADTVPVARVDHATIDVNLRIAALVGRVSLFASRGVGIGELRPESDQRPGGSFFRFGRARTRGVEVQLASRGTERAGRSASISYGYSTSEREWSGRWVRWAQDRRHQLRAFGQLRRGRVALFGALDAASGMPLTPISYRFMPDPSGLPVAALPEVGDPAPIYGPENSARTSGTLRIDAGVSWNFRGPGRSTWTVGGSVVNLLWGKVAPIVDGGQGAIATDRAGRPTVYRRLFDLPPIPTLTLRAEF
jgi:hypothetical protein